MTRNQQKALRKVAIVYLLLISTTLAVWSLLRGAPWDALVYGTALPVLTGFGVMVYRMEMEWLRLQEKTTRQRWNDDVARLIFEAATFIRQDAETLRDSHTVNGSWEGEEEAQEMHERELVMAAQLFELAGEIENR